MVFHHNMLMKDSNTTKLKGIYWHTERTIYLIIVGILIESGSSIFVAIIKMLACFQVDLNRPMSQVLSELTKYPIKTRLSLSGTLVVARDIAHAKIKERLDSGQGIPDYMKNHPVYYAGPAKTPTVRELFLSFLLCSLHVFVLQQMATK